MTPNHASVDQTETTPHSQTLLERVAFLGARPFASQVVQSPWNRVLDVPSLHKEVKEYIRTLVAGCGQPQAIRCLTVVAPPGYGKTHLLAWTRELLDARNDTVFVYVTPYTPGGAGVVTLEQHVMRATVEALWSRSRRQQAAFEQAVRSFLVECYDRILASGQRVKETLRAGTFWSRLFRRSRLRIGSQGTQDQLSALQRAFDRRAFLERAFADFTRRHPVGADGVRPDWDTFVAGCLLACGDARQRWHADRWLRADRTPPDVLRPFHLDDPCQGMEKIRNGLFTLQKMVGQAFCLAFDQLEDTYLALAQPGSIEATRFSQALGNLLRNLSVMPGFCLLFSFQLSAWQEFLRAVPPSLVHRMVEGYRAQSLPSLNDETAQELVRERMRVAVWSQLLEDPPADGPCFPFRADDVHRMRVETGGELRAFLQQAQQEFERRLASPGPPPPRPPTGEASRLSNLRLTGIEPREVMSHEPTAVLIRGDNLPAEVRVLFGGQPAQTPPVCRPGAGVIDVTTPVGLVGDVKVRVEAADDPTNGGSLALRFLEREVPRPYREHIDGQKLQQRRKELGLTQSQVAKRLSGGQHKITQDKISALERGVWKSVPEDLYDRLAGLYDMPLSSFLKR